MSFEEHPTLGFPDPVAKRMHELTLRNCESEGFPIAADAEHWIVASATSRVMQGEVKRPDGMKLGCLVRLSVVGLQHIIYNDKTVREAVEDLLEGYMPIEEIDVEPSYVASAMTFCQVYSKFLDDTGPEATLEYARAIKAAKEHHLPDEQPDPDVMEQFEGIVPGAKRVTTLIEAATDAITEHPLYEDDSVLVIFTGGVVGGFTAMGYEGVDQDDAARQILTDLIHQTHQFGKAIGVPLSLSVLGQDFDEWKAAHDKGDSE